MALGDVDDNDGDLDLALAVASSGWHGIMGVGTPKLWLNDGTGAFTSAPSQFPSVLSMPQQLALEDFDLDGDRDLLLVGAVGLGAPVTRWLSLNNGAGFFGPVIVLGTGVPYEIFATGDVNGDGLRDIAFDARVSWASGAQTTILLNAGGGTFTPMPSTAVPGLPRDAALDRPRRQRPGRPRPDQAERIRFPPARRRDDHGARVVGCRLLGGTARVVER